MLHSIQNQRSTRYFQRSTEAPEAPSRRNSVSAQGKSIHSQRHRNPPADRPLRVRSYLHETRIAVPEHSLRFSEIRAESGLSQSQGRTTSPPPELRQANRSRGFCILPVPPEPAQAPPEPYASESGNAGAALRNASFPEDTSTSTAAPSPVRAPADRVCVEVLNRYCRYNRNGKALLRPNTPRNPAGAHWVHRAGHEQHPAESPRAVPSRSVPADAPRLSPIPPQTFVKQVVRTKFQTATSRSQTPHRPHTVFRSKGRVPQEEVPEHPSSGSLHAGKQDSVPPRSCSSYLYPAEADSRCCRGRAACRNCVSPPGTEPVPGFHSPSHGA